MRRLFYSSSSSSSSSFSSSCCSALPLVCRVSLPVPLPVRSICQRHVMAWAALNCVSKDFFSFLFFLLSLSLSLFASPSSPSHQVSPVCLFVYRACCLLPFSASFASGGRRRRRQRDSLTSQPTDPANGGNPFAFFDFRLFLVTRKGSMGAL